MSAHGFMALLPWSRIEHMMHDLEEKGLDDEAVRDEIVAALDALIPAALLPPPWGCIAEALDGPGVRLALNLALRARQGKEKRAARREARKARKNAK